jgi:ANTAR domain
MSDLLIYDRVSRTTVDPANGTDLGSIDGWRTHARSSGALLARSPEAATVLNSLLSAGSALLAQRATVSLVEQASAPKAPAGRFAGTVLLVPVPDMPDERRICLRVEYLTDAVAVEADAVILGLLVEHAAEILRAETLRAELEAERERSANLTAALATNREIGAALGILMAGRRCTLEAAFDVLRVASQTTHRKLRDIAADVILTGSLEEAEPPPRPRDRRTGFSTVDHDGGRGSTA